MTNYKRPSNGIIEYTEQNPHPAGFIGIRVVIPMLGEEDYQEYFNFRGKSAEEIKALRLKAYEVAKEKKAIQEKRLAKDRITRPSRNELSNVYGISIHVESIGAKDRNPRIVVAAYGKVSLYTGSGIIFRKSKTITLLDYKWFSKTWREACKALSDEKGRYRIPSNWIKSTPTENELSAFIQGKIGEKYSLNNN